MLTNPRLNRARFGALQPPRGHPQPPSDANVAGWRRGALGQGPPWGGRSLAACLGPGRRVWHWGAGDGEAGRHLGRLTNH